MACSKRCLPALSLSYRGKLYRCQPDRGIWPTGMLLGIGVSFFAHVHYSDNSLSNTGAATKENRVMEA